MSAGYRAVQWNRHKHIYDALIAATILAFVVAFVGVSAATLKPPSEISAPVLFIRALALAAIIMLHVILAIGPLARLDDRFAPLLYNRRHLGVSFFIVALLHAALATLYYGGFGVQNPLVATLSGYGSFDSISAFPFEVLGFFALLIFFLMAATSHDFWLANLSPRVWKWLHMLVYPAYALVVLHVTLGALQSESSALPALLLLAGVASLTALHVLAGTRERARDKVLPPTTPDGWIEAGEIDALAAGSARVLRRPGGDHIAVYHHAGGISAVSNTCAHQGGPLGEGRIIDGCITCPWHGYQYDPASGCSPPPFTDKVPTYRVRIVGRSIQVDPQPLPPGTPVTPAAAPNPPSQAPTSNEEPDA